MPVDCSVAQRVLARHIVAAGQSARIAPALRTKVNRGLVLVGLDGNGRFEKPSYGLTAACNVLGDNGIELDETIHAGQFMPKQGHLTIRIALTNTEDVFSPVPVRNTMLFLSWAELDERKYEVLAYLS